MDDLDGEDAYKLLGVPDTATDDEIRRARRRKMREHHTDRGGNAQQAQLLNRAYLVLINDRAQYDRKRRQRKQPEPPPTDPWDRSDDAQAPEPPPTDPWDRSDDAQAPEPPPTAPARASVIVLAAAVIIGAVIVYFYFPYTHPYFFDEALHDSPAEAIFMRVSVSLLDGGVIGLMCGLIPATMAYGIFKGRKDRSDHA